LLGEIYGVTRLPQTNATVDIGDQNFQWYVRNGTFGSINSGQDINIPAGVRIYTAAGTSGPVYIANAVTLPAAQSSMSFGATALYSGSAGNAAAGVFSLSNFTNYTESTYGSLLVTNNYGIVGGSDAELDDNYRYRIQLKLQGQNGANEAAMRFQILMIPGIQDVVFAPAAGTFTCYVYGIASDGIGGAAAECPDGHRQYRCFSIDWERRGARPGRHQLDNYDHADGRGQFDGPGHHHFERGYGCTELHQ
jgi:uncharacterized phage protein gp47/JayE